MWLGNHEPDAPRTGRDIFFDPSSLVRPQADHDDARGSASRRWPSPWRRLDVHGFAMNRADLSQIYRDYIACLNRQDWTTLGTFVDDAAVHNGRSIGLSGYVAMLEKDFDEIPDLSFNVSMLVCDPPYVASRLAFDCTPKAQFFGLPINGRKISFAENVIYEFRGGKIVEVWSVIDKAGIEAQVGPLA